MKNRTLWGVIFALVVINGLTIAYFLSSNQPHSSEKPVFSQKASEEEIVATIGNTSISRQEWLNELESKFGKETLKEMINQAVVKNLAKKYNIQVSDEELDIEMKMIKASYGNFDGEEFEDEKFWREQLKANILLEELLTRDVKIPESELKNFYNENQELYHLDKSYRLAHILVHTKEEADQVVEELKSGSSFSTLAMEKSKDEFTANQGGELGYVTENSEFVPEEYITVAKTLKEKEWSNPIQTEEGYAVIYLEEMLDSYSYSFEEVRKQIRRQIALEQMGGAISIQPFWEEAKVTWFYENQQ